MEFNFDELLALTSKAFADEVKGHIDRQLEIREIMSYLVQVDTHGLTPEEAQQDPEADSPTVIVDYMTGWAGKPHELWTYWFDTYSGRFNYMVINHNHVERFNAMRDGTELPDIGVISY